MDGLSALIALAIAAVFLVPAIYWPAAGRWVVAVMFLGGAAFNALYTLPNVPDSLEALVATSFVPFYKEAMSFLAGWNATALALLVIAFEVTVGLLVLWRGRLARVGLLAA